MKNVQHRQTGRLSSSKNKWNKQKQKVLIFSPLCLYLLSFRVWSHRARVNKKTPGNPNHVLLSSCPSLGPYIYLSLFFYTENTHITYRESCFLFFTPPFPSLSPPFLHFSPTLSRPTPPRPSFPWIKPVKRWCAKKIKDNKVWRQSCEKRKREKWKLKRNKVKSCLEHKTCWLVIFHILRKQRDPEKKCVAFTTSFCMLQKFASLALCLA